MKIYSTHALRTAVEYAMRSADDDEREALKHFLEPHTKYEIEVDLWPRTRQIVLTLKVAAK